MRSRAPSPPLLVARRLTACSTICAPSLTSLLAGLRVVPCGNWLVQGRARAPKSRHSSGRRRRQPARRGAAGPRRRAQATWPALRHSATRSAAPSKSVLHGCGCPVRVSSDTRVASQHKAWPVGGSVQACLDAAGPRVPPQGRGACKPLLRDHLPLWPNMAQPLRGRRGSTRAPRRVSRPVRGQANTWSPNRSTCPPQPGDGPQRPKAMGRGMRNPRRKASCTTLHNSVVEACACDWSSARHRECTSCVYATRGTASHAASHGGLLPRSGALEGLRRPRANKGGTLPSLLSATKPWLPQRGPNTARPRHHPRPNIAVKSGSLARRTGSEPAHAGQYAAGADRLAD